MTTDDFDVQRAFVIDNAWRLLGMQDRDRLSPSHGCFHYAYWRDKTSEFPDARFQEAGATLGLLSLPEFDTWRGEGGLASSGQCREAFGAALINWQAQQYPEGCFDEWYKGERGFAATEFTMIAYGLAARFLGPLLEPDDRDRLSDVMRRAGGWLARRHDRVKSNHEAAAAAALALAWDVTGEATFKTAARAMLDDTLSRQTPEGWFPEIGGMDLGYCSVLMDYVMVYTLVSGDDAAIPAMRTLLDFMVPHLHPDGTIMPESGLCLNPYVSRLGVGLLSHHDPRAAAIIATFACSSPGRAGLLPTLADDLRLARWSYLPIVTHLLRPSFAAPSPGLDSLAACFPEGWTCPRQAAIAACHRGETHVYFAPAGGGAVRVYHGAALVLEDPGVWLITDQGRWGSGGYDPLRPVLIDGDAVGMTSSLTAPAFVYPGFLARLVLRLGCRWAWSSRLLRALIDAYRLRRRTAVNQSSAPLAKGDETISLTRTVAVSGSGVRITDTLASQDEPRAGSDVEFQLVHRGRRRPLSATGFFRKVRFVKELSSDDGELHTEALILDPRPPVE
ncbi:MAG: hypothetical protein H7840_08315 [Alphaproteobacteria bacterium]